MVGHTGFLIAHNMALGSSDGVSMFKEAGAVLDAQKETPREKVHVYGLIVERWGKSIVDVGGAGVELGVGGAGGVGVGCFGADSGAGVRLDALFGEFFTGREAMGSEGPSST